MSTVIKAVLFRLVVVGLIGAVFLVVAQIDFAESPKHFRVSEADVRVEVQPDGTLRVSEHLTFDFTGDFSGAYRDVLLAEGVRATDVRVREGRDLYRPGGRTQLGSYDEPGTFGAVAIELDDGAGAPDRGFRVVWHYSAFDEQRTFVVSYTIDGATRAYTDVLEVSWAIWGHQWEFWLDHLDATFSAVGPDGKPIEPLRGWVGPPTLGADVEIGGDAASTSVERLPALEQATMRVLFPVDEFGDLAGVEREVRSGLEAITEEEDETRRDASGVRMLAAFVSENIALICLIWGLIVVGLAAILYWAARDEDDPVPGYLPEPPEDIPPALAYAYAHEGEFDDRLVVATLLDLVDRGYYEAEPTEGEDMDLKLSVATDRPPPGDLADYEELTIDFFDRLLKRGPAALGELKDRVPEHSEAWRKRWVKLTEALDRAEEGQLEWELDLTGFRASLATIALLGFLVIGALYYVRTHLILPPLFGAIASMVLIYVLPATWLKRLDPASRRRNAEWSAFERWTRDFPRLDDDPPATLKLWRRVLVYAVAMGTAERVIGSGRIPEPVLAEASGSNLWLAHNLSGSGSGITPSFNGFASGFSSHVAPQSSDGGGGFSGGGGGFSGGGGGGAW